MPKAGGKIQHEALNKEQNKNVWRSGRKAIGKQNGTMKGRKLHKGKRLTFMDCLLTAKHFTQSNDPMA